MPKHTQKFLSKAGDDTQGLACSGVTRIHSRTIRHLLDLGATSLKERLSLFLAKKHIYPLHHHSRNQTRGRSNTASLATPSVLFFRHLSSLLDHHVLGVFFHLGYYHVFWHGKRVTGRNQAGREAWSFYTNFTFTHSRRRWIFDKRPYPWCLSESGGVPSPASSRIMNFASFCQTIFHITSNFHCLRICQSLFDAQLCLTGIGMSVTCQSC